MNAPVCYMDQTFNPAAAGWSPSLVIELALAQQSVRDICQSYGVDRAEYERLRADSAFRRAVEEAVETLKTDNNASFRLKARAQSEELLKTSWELIHKPLDEVSASVKQQLIAMTIRCAGLDLSIEQRARASATAQAAALTALQINIHLND